MKPTSPKNSLKMLFLLLSVSKWENLGNGLWKTWIIILIGKDYPHPMLLRDWCGILTQNQSTLMLLNRYKQGENGARGISWPSNAFMSGTLNLIISRMKTKKLSKP